MIYTTMKNKEKEKSIRELSSLRKRKKINVFIRLRNGYYLLFFHGFIWQGFFFNILIKKGFTKD